MTVQELKSLSDREQLSTLWGDSILAVIDSQTITPMPMKEFLDHCTACGGNWGGMLLTGIKELYPEVYDAIPDDMGHLAWLCICNTLTLLGIKADD